MKTELININELKPYKNNARKNNTAIAVVKQSIENFGFRNPILIDKDNIIIAGHTRLQAAEELEMTEVPIIRINDLTEAQIKAFRIMDNKSSEFADWDYELLKEEFNELEDTEEFNLTGFTTQEITKIWEKEQITNDYDANDAEKVDKLGKHIIDCPKCGHKFERK